MHVIKLRSHLAWHVCLFAYANVKRLYVDTALYIYKIIIYIIAHFEYRETMLSSHANSNKVCDKN